MEVELFCIIAINCSIHLSLNNFFPPKSSPTLQILITFLKKQKEIEKNELSGILSQDARTNG